VLIRVAIKLVPSSYVYNTMQTLMVIWRAVMSLCWISAPPRPLPGPKKRSEELPYWWHTLLCAPLILFPFNPRQLSGLETQLQYERERREVLEAELDQLRKQLQKTTSQLQHYQALPEKP